ncbi:hypothetical protein V8D89_015868 [Ganoderma adspersum]
MPEILVYSSNHKPAPGNSETDALASLYSRAQSGEEALTGTRARTAASASNSEMWRRAFSAPQQWTGRASGWSLRDPLSIPSRPNRRSQVKRQSVAASLVRQSSSRNFDPDRRARLEKELHTHFRALHKVSKSIRRHGIASVEHPLPRSRQVDNEPGGRELRPMSSGQTGANYAQSPRGRHCGSNHKTAPRKSKTDALTTLCSHA